ncbi:MAG: hypothetical protein DMG51_04555 [Acidobacteria bacterium]|nr:MAG: hypothetical protein DMG51_04555 [Acidobacteriota bacterium]
MRNPAEGGGIPMSRLLKRIALLFFAFIAVLAAAIYLLYFRRAALPRAAPHARAVPVISTIPGLSACWVETAKTFSSFSFGLTAGSILVKHPAGDLLIDTGSSSQYDREISGFPFRTWFKLKSLAGQLKPKVSLPDREELQFAANPSVRAGGYVIAAPTLRFEPTPYVTFDESTDLYGDGSVVVVPLRGHTPGSVGIFLNLSPTLRLFYVGDAVDEERGFEERVGKSLLLRDSDNDAPLANQIVGQLSELHEKVPELAIVPAHGRSAYKKFFPSGPLSCVSRP